MEFEKLVKEMRKYQKMVYELGTMDNRNMARAYEKKVDEYLEDQQKLF
jgi:hypothetical protein